MVVSARPAGLSVAETADLPGFFHTIIFRVSREWSKKRVKNCEKFIFSVFQTSVSCLGKNPLLIVKVRGEWPGCFELIGRRENLK